MANRGEIAVRVMRAVRAVNAIPVAVYSDADSRALHVQLADEAFRIGRAPVAESYLNIDAILMAARESESEAVHPGYGLLSENAEFAQAVLDEGLVFIGPPPDVIRLMGDKAAAKTLMADNGVPVIPGYSGDDQSVERFVAEGEILGYPLMIKAVAGGGGRGMRLVPTVADLASGIEAARREADNAFGDDRIFLEKVLVAPRHIEVQILADSHGTILHLGERDCSIQRRHQKVIEEAPSAALDQETRNTIGSVAVRGAAAAGYVNAGTVEFLWSAGEFYFLEMNTRIQVEHPVTEMVTGVDLVRAQIEVAAGGRLEFSQSTVRLEGHAIECRLYAEDPDRDFLPQAGHLTVFETPTQDGRLRIDTGVFSGADVSRFYDPLLAKIIARGPDRATAVNTLRSALGKVEIAGISTNLGFLKKVVSAPAFMRDDISTAFLEGDWWRLASSESLDAPAGLEIPMDHIAIAAAAADLATVDALHPGRGAVRGWRVAGESLPLAYEIDGVRFLVRASRRPGGSWEVEVNGANHEQVTFFTNQFIAAGDVVPDLVVMIGSAVLRFELRYDAVHDAFQLREWQPVREGADYSSGEGRADLSGAGRGRGGGVAELENPARSEFMVRRLSAYTPPERLPDAARGTEAASSEAIVAPMPGSVVKVNVAVGDRVQAHQALVVLEAMKMEHVLESPHAGTVRAIYFSEGDMVSGAATVMEVGPD